jgi:hypothetical protein
MLAKRPRRVQHRATPGCSLFGTADRAIDDTPLSPGAVAVAQVALAIAGATAGVVAAARTLAAARSEGLDARGALAALWATGVAGAGTVAVVVALLSSDLARPAGGGAAGHNPDRSRA